MMNETEKSHGSWWQTAPGMLTAIAGIITALGGLLAVLHQIGVFSDANKAVFVSPPPGAAAGGREATAAAREKANEPANAGPVLNAPEPATGDSAPPYIVTFPNGAEVTLRRNGREGTFTILAAQVEDRNTGKLSLTLTVRAHNKDASYDLNFGGHLFRLLVDDVPRAPAKAFGKYVDPRSAEEGDVRFEFPKTTRKLVLSLNNGEEEVQMPITLKRSR